MDKLLELLEKMPSSSETRLDSQIAYVEAMNAVVFTPIGLAIAESLKELRAIKRSRVAEWQLGETDKNAS
jgi:hypothetical protein